MNMKHMLTHMGHIANIPQPTALENINSSSAQSHGACGTVSREGRYRVMKLS